MLRRLGIRAKVLAVLAVPMIVLLVAGTYISYGAIQDLRYARATQTVVRTLDALSPLTAAFQQERILSLTGAPEDQVLSARQVTDDALADARKVTEQLDFSVFPDSVVLAFRDQQESYRTALPQLRQRIDDNAQRVIIKNGFQDIFDGQTRVLEGVTNALRNRDLAQYIAANRELALLSDALVNEYITGIELKLAVADSPALARSFQSQTTATELARERARLAVANLDIDGLAVSSGDPTANLLSMRALFTQGSVGSVATVDLGAWTTQTTNQMTMVGEVNGGVLEGAGGVAATGVTDARDRALVTVALALLALAASFFFAVTVARSIVVPLRRLTSAAADVREQLPRLVEQVSTPGEGPEIMLAPIPVRSQDEVGRLAQAFNAVNATTVQVAQEQAALRGSIAEMFVNVARRDQVLLNRQLSFIDSLERAEEDPGTLANLFRLDHLATRMRRNAESLLVLAGIDSGRRLRDAMPLSDVIRTASSEIEQYDRVQLDLQVDPHMLGFNALSAAHLLAEILENATVFSEPETPVVVSTGVSGASVVVRITDQGLGMTDAEIEAANRKIVSVSAGDALGAQRLGLFVVGRLAQRLGAEVTLRKRPGGTGTEAFVQFPSTLFSANEVSAYGALPPSAPAQSAGLPEIEIPEVRAVDLAELTDGETSLGLPRRRRGDDTGASPITEPAAAELDDDAPIPVPMLETPGGLPSRSRKTFDEDKIVLPVAPEATLSPELSVDTGEWAPAVPAAPRNAGLPTRARAATSAWASEPQEDVRPAAAAPADPTARAGLFSGFRSGRDVAAAAPAANGFVVPGLEPDEATDTATEADSGWPVPSWRDLSGGLPSRGAAAPAPADEAPEQPVEQWSAPHTDDSWTAPQTDEQPWSPTLAEEPWSPAEATASQDEVVETAGEHAPAASWEQPQADAPSWEQPATPAASWEQPQADAPAWEQPSEPAASWEQPQADAPAWEQPSEPAASWEQPQADAPSWEQPQQPAASWEQPQPQAETPAWEQPAGDPVWTQDEPAAWQAAPEQAPVEQQHVAEPEPSFTSYSGYSGWAGSSDSPAQDYTAPYVPFERSLDEARAWHTGALPVVPEPTRPAQPAWTDAADQQVDGYAQQVEVEDEPEVEEEVDAPWAPVAAVTPPAEAPSVELEPEAAPAQGSWQAPTWQEQPAPVAEAAPAAEPDQWRPATPAWARSAAADQPTQRFAPIQDEQVAPAPVFEAPAPVQQAPVQPAPVQQAPAQPAPVAQTPAWQPTSAPAAASTGPAFGDLVAPADDKPKRRWGNFFSRKKDDVDEVEHTPAPAVARTPVRSSAWGPEGAAAAPTATQAPATTGWEAPAWTAPPSPQSAATPVVHEARPAPSWSPPEWAGRQPAPASTVPHPSVPPSAAPRVGTLDDEVAAMLALRSDIQEQALSELSQLSAYRPSAVGASGSERLAKRVPSAVPAAPAPMEERPVQRDADQLRSRLSSFQTGTSRGRRAAHGPQDGDHQ